MEHRRRVIPAMTPNDTGNGPRQAQLAGVQRPKGAALTAGLDAEVDMQVVCMLHGGPERLIIDGKRKRWRFEDHHYCGPVVLGKNGDPLEVQPPENSPFWDAVNLWYAQGKRTNDPKTGEIWCVWDRPTMQKMRHLGGRHYMLVSDDEKASN